MSGCPRLPGHLFILDGACQCGRSLRDVTVPGTSPRKLSIPRVLSQRRVPGPSTVLGAEKSLSVCCVTVYTQNLQAAGWPDTAAPTPRSQKAQNRCCPSVVRQGLFHVVSRGPGLAPGLVTPPTPPHTPTHVSSLSRLQWCLHRACGRVSGGVLVGRPGSGRSHSAHMPVTGARSTATPREDQATCPGRRRSALVNS